MAQVTQKADKRSIAQLKNQLKHDKPWLNDMNVEIFGGLVRINVLLDTEGLDKLEQKIQALRILIEDNEVNEGDQQNTEGCGKESAPTSDVE